MFNDVDTSIMSNLALKLVIILFILSMVVIIIEKLKIKAGYYKKKTRKSRTLKKVNNLSPKKPNSNKLKNPTEMQLLTADINDLEGVDFERLVAMFYKEKGYKTEIIGGSGDHGVDLVLTDPKDNYKIAVQCKRYAHTRVSNSPIAIIAGSKRFYGCHKAWVITNNTFTKPAERLAKELDVELYNGLYVQEVIDKWRKKKVKDKNL